jgi:serine phosphatase RsbU (regulator of sigma subunit)
MLAKIHWLVKFQLVFGLFISALIASAQTDSIYNNDVDDNEVESERYSIIDLSTWKYNTADSKHFAYINYNDEYWNVVTEDSAHKLKLNGAVRWYRIHFEVDSQIKYKPLAFYVSQFGSAAEIYVDSMLIKRAGRIGSNLENEDALFNPEPTPLVLSLAEGNHIIAIRCSDFHRVKSADNGINVSSFLRIYFQPINSDVSTLVSYKKYFPFIFFTGMFVALFALHFIMYAFNRQQTINALYSLYCLGVAFISMYSYYVISSSSFNLISSLTQIVLSVVPLLTIPLVGMVHTIFYNKLGKLFTVLLSMYIISVIFIFFSGKLSLSITLILTILITLLSIINIIKVIVIALKQGKDGARIFALVILLAPIMAFLFSKIKSVSFINPIIENVASDTVFFVSLIVSLPLSMSIFLARDMARMVKKLGRQVDEITDLSQKTLQQEQEKKRLLENQNFELENTVYKRTQEVMKQKIEIENKNKEITESLHYAKRIQAAILPPVEVITQTFSESFILYLPKDIVSGDFYAFAEKENEIIIAVADCTGHGVSGALMSMIGSSLLNQIINEKKITAPAEILNLLNDGVIDALKQRTNTSHDGMDIAICHIDKQNRLLRFAGANRPLWLLHNEQILVYKPNKFPIGGIQILHDQPYNEHSIVLQNNDVVYLFTDGFADQFGGSDAKKLLTKNLKQHILDMQHLPLLDQHQMLLNIFNNWKGNIEQVDDVLILAFKI